MELIENMNEIICRHCDGISHADTCELDKAECPVLQKMPGELIPLIVGEIKKWGNEDCPHVNQGSYRHTIRMECDKCWQALFEKWVK